jgi:hypothetical protein
VEVYSKFGSQIPRSESILFVKGHDCNTRTSMQRWRLRDVSSVFNLVKSHSLLRTRLYALQCDVRDKLSLTAASVAVHMCHLCDSNSRKFLHGFNASLLSHSAAVYASHAKVYVLPVAGR